MVALLTNVVTDRPAPALIGGLVAATAVAALLAVLQSRSSGATEPGADHVQVADGGRISDSHLDVDPATAVRTRQEPGSDTSTCPIASAMTSRPTAVTSGW